MFSFAHNTRETIVPQNFLFQKTRRGNQPNIIFQAFCKLRKNILDPINGT